MHPEWFTALAWVCLAAGVVSALAVVGEMLKNGGQPHAVMNVVWPVTALYFGPFAVAAYWKTGRQMRAKRQKSSGQAGGQQQHRSQQPSGKKPEPTRNQVAVSVFHCGAGCTLGDIAAEFLVFGLALEIAGSTLLADYTMDFAFAYLLGIVFQYLVITPMKQLSPGEGIRAALKADTLSIVSFQIGMYGWMALVYFVFFPAPHLHPNEAGYWFMMQTGMIAGFFTSYPANVWLLKKGIKEKMG